MAKEGVIYKIVSPNNKIYIGQTINFKNRILKYKKLLCTSQYKIYNSLLKYGYENHIFKIIEETNINLLNERERYWQEYYNVLSKNGLNCLLTKTNNKTGFMSDESKLKMSLARLNKKLPLSTIEKMKISSAKRNYKHSEETLIKIVKANNIISNNKRLKLSEAKKKLILDFNTGIYYNSANELSALLGIKRTTLTSRLAGQNINKTPYKYV